MIDKKLLSILVCPVAKTTLYFNREANELVSTAAGLAYPIRDDIPVLMESEARVLSAEEVLEIKKKHPRHE